MSNTDKRSRYSIDLAEDFRVRLGRLARGYGITQGEAIEVMIMALNQMPPEQQPVIDALFKARRDEKVAARRQKAGAVKQFKDLTPRQQRAAIEAAKQVA